MALTLSSSTATRNASISRWGSPVTLNVAFPTFEHICGSPPQAAAAAITGGVFLPNNTCWPTETIYWNGANSIDIELQGPLQLKHREACGGHEAGAGFFY